MSYDVTTASVLGHADIGSGLLQAGYTRAALKIVLSLTCCEPRERLSLQGAFEQLLDIALAINVGRDLTGSWCTMTINLCLL